MDKKIKMKAEKQMNIIRDIFWDIPLNSSIKLLTGHNGSGKSFIRGQLGARLKKEKKGKLIHTSQELRTSSNPALGALSGFAHDLEWLPTSYSTINSIKQVSRTASEGKNCMLVIDEPEIGCGEETIISICKWLNEEILSKKYKYGVLIITHNRYLVEHLKYKHFLNLDGYKTKKEWLNRKLIPTNLKILKDNKLFFLIRGDKK